MELDKFIFVSIFFVCFSFVVLNWGREIYVCVMEVGLVNDIMVGNVFISMYVKCGSVWDVCCVFDVMVSWDEVFWIILIGVYVESGYGEEFLKIYYVML